MSRTEKITFRLPVDHPIFAIPQGQRTTVGKEWLEVGRKLDQINTRLAEQGEQTGNILARIATTLDSVTRKIHDIEARQAVVEQEGEGLAVIIDDLPNGDEENKDGFKIPSEIIDAFNNWGADK